MRSYAPTTVKSLDGHVNGFDRNVFQMPAKEYGRRSACESTNSAIKRTMDSTLRSR